MLGFLVSIIALILFSVTAILMWVRDRECTDKITGELDTYYIKLKEKRRTVRLDKRLSVICKVLERPDSHWSVFSKDISGEGICVFLPEILPQDAIVDLEIELPEGKRVIAHGKVAWIKKLDSPNNKEKRQFSVGIKFINISPKDKDNLVNFVSKSLAN